MWNEALNSTDLQNHIIVISNRAKSTKVPVNDALASMNALQKYLIPKYLNLFLPHLNQILDALLCICDDTNVSARHTSLVVLNSSVTVILPYQKNPILNFITSMCNRKYKPHALIAMVDIELKIALFLTHKIAFQLFCDSFQLYMNCSLSSSEIVHEGLYKSAPKIRLFLNKKKFRLKIIEALGKPKDSVLSERWAMKTAAIFAFPDLIEKSLPLLSTPIIFLSELPITDIKKYIPENIKFEELLPFVERDPTSFFDRIHEPPSEPRELSSFLSLLKYMIPFNFVPSFSLDLFTDPKNSSDITLFPLELECFALFSLNGHFQHSMIYHFFKNAIEKKTPSAVSALAICFNRYPSIQLFEIIMDLPIASPTMSKSIIIFLTEVDFSHLIESESLKKQAIKKIVDISHSNHDIIQNTLLERCLLFDCGKTIELVEELAHDLDLFDSIKFQHSIRLIAQLITRDMKGILNYLFSLLKEIDQAMLWGDASSILTTLSVVKKFCLKCPKVSIPLFLARFPMLVLRAIIAFLTGEWDEKLTIHQYNQLLDKVKASTLLLDVLQKQPLISLFEIRDKAASCAAAIHALYKFIDEKTIDTLGSKLLPWPSKNTWKLISTSARNLVLTTQGLYSTDNKIALAAVMKAPDKFNLTSVDNSLELTAFAISQGVEIEFELSIELVQIIDKISKTFPEKIAEKLKGSWYIVCIQYNLKNHIVSEFYNHPFHEWNGPAQFWYMLPQFLIRLRNKCKFIPTYDIDKCDQIHTFFINRNIGLFQHDCFADYGEITFHKSRDIIALNPQKLEIQEYYEPEMLRGMRLTLYQQNSCQSFTDLLSKAKPISNNDKLRKSLVNFLNSADCEFGSFEDCMLLILELSICSKNRNASDILHYLQYTPFRGMHAQYATSIPNTSLPSINQDQMLLESEMIRLIPIYAHHNIQFPTNAITHTSLAMITSFAGKSFTICCKYNVTPPINKSTEAELIKYIDMFGVTPFVIATMDKWILDNDILPIINISLSSAFRRGTYYTRKLARLMRDAMMLHKSAIPVIEAFILASEESPFRKLLETEFKIVKRKLKI